MDRIMKFSCISEPAAITRRRVIKAAAKQGSVPLSQNVVTSRYVSERSCTSQTQSAAICMQIAVITDEFNANRGIHVDTSDTSMISGIAVGVGCADVLVGRRQQSR